MDAELGHFLTNSFGEHYLYSVNRNAFNAVGSATVFSTHFGDEFKQKNTLYIVVGTDSGLLLKHNAGSECPRGSRFLFVELPEVLDLLGDQMDASDHIRVSTGEGWSAAAGELEIGNYIYLGRVRLISSIGAGDGHLDAYRDLRNKLDSELFEPQLADPNLIGQSPVHPAADA